MKVHSAILTAAICLAASPGMAQIFSFDALKDLESALPAGVQALTVRPTADRASWEVADIRVPGNIVPAACKEICETAAAELRERYDLLSEDQLTPDYDLSMT